MTYRIERFGAATLILGDSRDVLPTLGKVDAVVLRGSFCLHVARLTKANEVVA